MANVAQKDYWRSPRGDVWSELADRIDATFAPVAYEIRRRAAPVKGARVLDVGCGAGAVTRAVQAAGGIATGLDLSPRLLAHAARVAPGASLIEADAQDHSFETGAFDLLVSRFGVMFFEDPVAAFANLNKAVRPGGRFVFAAWAAAEQNPWFHIPNACAEAVLGPVESDPDGPNPTAFRDIPRVVGLFEEAGWTEVAGEAVALELTPPGPMEQVADFATQLGGASRIISAHGGTEADRARIAGDIARALAVHDGARGVRVPAVINFFSGQV